MLELVFCWKALAGWSPISITSVVCTISEPVRRTVFRFQDCPNPILVAEEYDPAFVADCIDGHYGAFDCCLRGEIASHGIYTNL